MDEKQDKISLSSEAAGTVALDRRKTWRSHVLRTSCNALALLMLGVSMSMKGPSFLDLQMISGVDVEKGSYYFTIHAFGYMTGSLVAGTLYGRCKVKTILVIIPMIICSVMQVLTPWCDSFVLMLAVNCVPSIFWAILETTVTTVEVHAWEGNSDSAMQFLSFAYSLGGIIGPLIVEPFLSPKHNNGVSEPDAGNLSLTSGSEDNTTTVFNETSGDFLLPAQDIQRYQSYGSLYNNTTTNSNSSNSSMDVYFLHNNSSGESTAYSEGYKSEIHYAYLIAGILTLISSVPFCALYVRTRRTIKRNDNPKEEPAAARDGRLPLKMYIILTGIIGMFYFFYTTVDDSYPMYLSVFVVSHLNWSKEEGARVSSLYWGCSTATKLAMVILVRRVNPSLVLLLSTIGMVLSMALFTVCAHFEIHSMIWLCTAALALSQSPVFGGGFAWADANLLKFDGRVTSCAMLFASLGAMVDPMLLGASMKEISPMAFPVLLTFQALVTCIIFLLMLVVAKPYITRRFGPPRRDISVSVSAVEEEQVCLNGDVVKKGANVAADTVQEENRNPSL